MGLKMAEPKEITSFKAFIESTQAAKHTAFVEMKGNKVVDKEVFAEMQAHILKLYDKVEVKHSFVDKGGAVFDCIPIAQQPSLKGVKERIPVAPDAPQPEKVELKKFECEDALIASPLGADKKDRFGNIMQCPPGTIPVRRVTINDLAKFETLRNFFRKTPLGIERPPQPNEPASVPPTHRWAHAFQNVANGGGHSYLNIWDPAIGANQIFSLTQQWYVGGSGSKLQTVECGLQVYPQLYNSKLPHFFIYYTADGYNATGCYNLTCNAFVQISSAYTPGMAIGPISVLGGSQYIFELATWHTGGRWWIYVNGTKGSNAIGYYPDSLFKGGALTGNASEIDYGGETVGTTTFPPMGSGHFANEGWQKAAYQRTIGYYPPQGGAMVNANLTPSQNWPNCYTAKVDMFGSPWLKTLWFGGPGGNC